MQGGMAGSHLRWSVYEDMVNKVWPQCSERERRNIWFVMRRDLGTYWRPDGWSDFDMSTAHGEGEWKADDNGYAIDRSKPDDMPKQVIYDKTPWMYFRQVLARFDPENQYAVTLQTETNDEVESLLTGLGLAKQSIISTPTLMLSADGTRYDWRLDTPLTVRTYKWQDLIGNDAYFIDWRRRCDPDKITKAVKLESPTTGRCKMKCF
jgi:hypothetical protein